MITKIYNLYPNGVEKSQKGIGKNTPTDHKIKARALSMIGRDISLKLIAKKLGLDPSTVSLWIKPAERYL